MRDVKTDKAVDLGSWIGRRRAMANWRGAGAITPVNAGSPRSALDPVRRSLSIARVQRTGSVD